MRIEGGVPIFMDMSREFCEVVVMFRGGGFLDGGFAVAVVVGGPSCRVPPTLLCRC